jgi:NAD(P)H-hydrate epimerase
MASGGMGDVLTGVIAALLAASPDPIAAAVAGAHYHGRAADLAAEGGERGLNASDVVESLREALA